MKKKMVEVTAFKVFEEWWTEKSNEYNEKLLSSRQQQQQFKTTCPLPVADLGNGDHQSVTGLPGDKPSSVADLSSFDRSHMMDTLSGLFDESGSFAGGLLGMRKLRLTSMPSFRKKSEPPKKDSEKDRARNIQDDDDEEEDDDDDQTRRPAFRGPRTPEGSEIDDNQTNSESDSESDSPYGNKNDHYLTKDDRDAPGRNYKPPSPPPSPITTRKDFNKKVKLKAEKKSHKIVKLTNKLSKIGRDIYSSSPSSSDSEITPKGHRDYDEDDDDDDDSDSDDQSDIDVMSLVKKAKEPARKVAVYTSDEEEDTKTKSDQKTNDATEHTSLLSSPSDSDADKPIDVCGIEKVSHKKIKSRTSQPKQRSQQTKAAGIKINKDGTARKKYVSRKPKTSVPNKKQKVRGRSAKDDDTNYVVSGLRRDENKAIRYPNVSYKVEDADDLLSSRRKNSCGIASSDATCQNNRLSQTRDYDESPIQGGYLQLLSDVASGVKQAEVNTNLSVDSVPGECNNARNSSMDNSFYKTPALPISCADENRSSVDEISRQRTCSINDDLSKASLTPSGQHREATRRTFTELADHNYSLKPWMEVKARKGRKPKHKASGFLSNEFDFDVSSGDETIYAHSSDIEESLSSSHNFKTIKLLLEEHNYCVANIHSLREVDYKSEPSDSEYDEFIASQKPQIYVEGDDLEITGRSGKFTLEMIPHIGKEVDVFSEKAEQEKNINVVDDEEEEGECHSSSDEDRMVIDEGVPTKSVPVRKRKRSSMESDGIQPTEKKAKHERKPSQSGKYSSNKLPRELVNLFHTNFTAPELKQPKFTKRDFKEEAYILYEFVTKGINTEDANFIKLQYEKLLKREQEKAAGQTENQERWVLDTKWVHHSIKTDNDFMLTKKSRKSKHGPSEPHKTGSARTEGYYKASHQSKRYSKHAHGVEEHHLLQFGADDFVLPSTSSTSLLPTETSVDAVVRKRAQQNREARTEGRRWQNLLTTNLGEDIAELLKFNQLKSRKKQLKFSRSRIHDWGLFAMEPIAEGELVIEYVGQVIRQSVADLREKRYEADGIGSSYLFRIEQNTIVDATKFGNLSRFINHCCNPNCYAKIVSVDGMKRIVIYSRRDIDVNEEITYDYKFPIEDEKIPCHCGAPGCRGTLN